MDPVTIDHPSDVAAAVKAGQDQAQLLPEVADHRRAVIVPKSSDLRSLEREKQDSPRFVTASPQFNEVKAFIAYVNDFKRIRISRIFYRQDGKFQSVIDYHDANDAIGSHGDHTANLHLMRSPEWIAWAGMSEKPMGQEQFAEFIEDNARDLIEPDPVVMMQVATSLKANQGGTFRRATNQANGSIGIQWDQQTTGTTTVDGKEVEVPAVFKIGIRPFMGCERYPVECRLRYRIKDGSLVLFYKALHLEPITESALEAIVARVRDETGIEPALGSHDAEAFKRGT